MREKNNYHFANERFILILLFLFGVLIHFILGYFCKRYETYPDELRYYSIARSIYSGNGLSIRGISTDFQKIAYAIVLTPTFFVRNAQHRITVINLLNSILMMSSLFPTYLICKELKLGRKAIICVLLSVSIWPDLIITTTFMSENLYWPVFLFFVLIWIKSKNSTGNILPIICGIICYIGYLTKEIFLAVLLACVAFEVIFPIVNYFVCNRKKQRKSISLLIIKKLYDRDEFIKLFLFIFSFGICFVFMKLTVFHGLGNSYNQQSIGAICTKYNFLYMLYAFMYYLIAIVIAYFVFPIIMPAVFFDKLSENAKRLCSLATLFLIIASAIIAYTISVREDLGRVAPRLHLRYFGPIFEVIICVFASLMQEISIDEIKKRGKAMRVAFGSSMIAILFLYKGVTFGSAVDQFALEAFRKLASNFPNLMPTDGNNMVFYTGSAIVNIIICFWICLGYRLAKYKKKLFILFFAIISCSLSLINSKLCFNTIKNAMSIDESVTKEICAINGYLDNVSGKNNIVYITDGSTVSQKSKAMDTYMDRVDGFLYVDSLSIENDIVGETALVRDIKFREPIFGNYYDTIESVDYIITESSNNNSDFTVQNCSIVNELSNDQFFVYRNNNPEKIELKYNNTETLD